MKGEEVGRKIGALLDQILDKLDDLESRITDLEDESDKSS